jgi:enolase
MSKIKNVWAREILDSRAVPTVETACLLDSGEVSVSSVPAGASTGTHEGLELRDSQNQRFFGMGVLQAVNNVNTILGPAIIGMDPTDQEAIDKKLIALDGTENKSKYGANAILSISEVVAKSASSRSNQPLYSWIFALATKYNICTSVKVPMPLFNMINGGKHGAGNLDFQEFWVIPTTTKSYSEGLQIGAEIYHAIGANLKHRGAIHSVGDEGGYAPDLFTNADALEVFVESIHQSNYSLGRDVLLGLDVASNSFYKDGEYLIKDRASAMTDTQLEEFYKALIDQYKLAIIEDPFHEDAWETWESFTGQVSQTTLVVGDDLLCTNPKRVEKAIKEKACNSILVKPNQVGTVTETLQVIKMAKDAGWKIIVSHRSGETNDSFIADFAVGVSADYVKFGAPARGERVAKYNRLSTIDVELGRMK